MMGSDMKRTAFAAALIGMTMATPALGDSSYFGPDDPTVFIAAGAIACLSPALIGMYERAQAEGDTELTGSFLIGDDCREVGMETHGEIIETEIGFALIAADDWGLPEYYVRTEHIE